MSTTLANEVTELRRANTELQRRLDPNALLAANLSPGGSIAEYSVKNVPVKGPIIYTQVRGITIVTKRIGPEDQGTNANPTAPTVRYEELGAGATHGAD